MTLPPLATATDLSDRNIAIPAGVRVGAILDAASAAVRDAAGCPILSASSVVTLVAYSPLDLDLPAGPVTSVASVKLTADQSAVTGWRKVGDSILFGRRWSSVFPVEVDVDMTHGLAAVPADIVDLVCGMASMAFSQSGEEYGTKGRLQSFRLDDYSESFTLAGGLDAPSGVVIPDSVRHRLRARFGTSAAVIRVRG